MASDQTDTLSRGYWPSFNVGCCCCGGGGWRTLLLLRRKPCLLPACRPNLGTRHPSSLPLLIFLVAPSQQIPYHLEVYNASGYPAFVAQQAQRGPLYAAAAGTHTGCSPAMAAPCCAMQQCACVWPCIAEPHPALLALSLSSSCLAAVAGASYQLAPRAQIFRRDVHAVQACLLSMFSEHKA